MPLSNSARRLLAEAAGGIIGGAVGGQEGFVGGVQGAAKAADTVISDEQKSAAQAEKKRQFDVSTMLNLLDTPGIAPESRQAIARGIAEHTGMNPSDLKITMSKNFRAADLLSVIGDKDVPSGAREEAWRAFAHEFGLKEDVSFSGLSSAFQDLSPEEKQSIFDELRDPNKPITDINRVAFFLGNFNGEGDPITSAQLKALGLSTESGLSYEQRLGLLFTKHDLDSSLTPKDFFNFGKQMITAGSIMGRSTISPKEIEANARIWATGLEGLVQTFERRFGTNPFKDRSQNSPSPSGPIAKQNLSRVRQAILRGDIKTADEAVNLLVEQGKQVVSDTDKQLIEKWVQDAGKQDQGNQ